MSPTPWTADQTGAVFDADDETVADVWNLGDVPLIAAAPDLYEACRKMLASLANYGQAIGDLFGDDEEFLGARTAMRKAVRKAAGERPEADEEDP